MKKTILLALFCACTSIISAQGVKTVFCETFYYTEGAATAGEATELRAHIMSAMSETQRVKLLDATTTPLNQTTGADAAAARRELIKLAGADYILEGTLNKSQATTHTIKGEEGKKDSYKYEHVLVYTLKLVNAETGYQDSKTYTESYTSYSNPASAKSEVYSKAYSNVRGFVNTFFPLNSTISEVGYTKSKDEMTSCYITLGSNDGVKAKDYFEVFQVAVINGEKFESKIGAVEVVSVGGEHLAKCKVYKGGAELLAAIDKYKNDKERDPEHAEPLRVRTAEKGMTAWQKVYTTTGSVAATAAAVYLVFIEELGGSVEGE